jgi:hypothetical protein
MAFVDWADQHSIILLILPPHTTHRLQPLDVGLFQPLSTYYSWELDQLMNQSAGHVSVSKTFFWPMFKRSWDKAFTKDNISSAFRKSGIWPVDGSHIIKTITRPTLKSPEKKEGLRTPKTTKAIRRFHLAYDQNPTEDKVKKLFSTTLHLSTQVAILEHENRGLYNAIDLQKKKGRQGVRLNLAGQSNKDIIDCYSPGQVVKAREYQEQKEAFKAAEEQAKLDRKIKRAANALRRKEEEKERAQKKLEREAKAAQKRLEKERAAASRAAKNALKEHPIPKVPKAKKDASTVQKQHKVSTKARPRGKALAKNAVVEQIEEGVALGVAVGKTASRTVNLPQRFR